MQNKVEKAGKAQGIAQGGKSKYTAQDACLEEKGLDSSDNFG